ARDRERRTRRPQQRARRDHPLLHESGADLGSQRVPFPQGVRAGGGSGPPPVLPRADRVRTRRPEEQRSDRMPALQGGDRGEEAPREGARRAREAARRAGEEKEASRGGQESRERPLRRQVIASAILPAIARPRAAPIPQTDRRTALRWRPK